MAQLLYAATNYFVTNLTTVNGIDSSQTTGIILNDVSGIADLSKPSILAIDWVKNTDGTLDTTNLEYIEYTSIDSETKELQGVTRGVDGYAAKAHDFGAVIVFPISKSVINRLADLVTAISSRRLIEAYVNGTSGYNLYSDGYVEQWGVTSSTNITGNNGVDLTITLPKTMTNTNYLVQVSMASAGAYWSYVVFRADTSSATQFVVTTWNNCAYTALNISIAWKVIGYAVV